MRWCDKMTVGSNHYIKRGISFFVAFAISFSMFSFSALRQSARAEEFQLVDDFEKYEITATPTGWSTSGLPVAQEENGNKYVPYKEGSYGIYHTFEKPVDGHVIVEAKIKYTGSGTFLRAPAILGPDLSGKEAEAAYVYVHNDNLRAYDGNTETKVLPSMELNRWYTVRVEADVVQQQYQVYVDGYLMAEELRFRNEVKGLKTVLFRTPLDDVKISYGNRPVNVTEMEKQQKIINEALEDIKEYETKIADLPEQTYPEKLKKASLQLSYTQAADSIRVGKFEQSKLILEDIDATIPVEFSYPDTSHRFFKELSVTEGNPYLDSVYKWFEDNIKKEDEGWFIATAEQTPWKGFYGNYGSRGESDNIERYVWIATHPESKYKENTEAMVRVLKRVYCFMDSLVSCDDPKQLEYLYDWFGAEKMMFFVNLIDEVYPEIIMPNQREMYKEALRKLNKHWLDENDPGGWSFNKDCGLMGIFLNTGIFLDDDEILAEAEKRMNNVNGMLYEDGGFLYMYSSAPVPSYQDMCLDILNRIYLTTGNEQMIELIKGTEYFGTIAVEPGFVQDFTTCPPNKWMWNTSSDPGTEVVEYYTQNPYLRNILNRKLVGYGTTKKGADAISPMYAMYYRNDVEPAPLPDNYTVFDRNINGPRARYGSFSYTVNGRMKETSPIGNQTFVGSIIVDQVKEDSVYPLNAALLGVFPGVRVKEGAGFWDRNATYSSNEKPVLSMGRNFSAFSVSYDLTGQSAGPSAWETGWKGRQQWILLEDRIIGVMETYCTESQQAYEATARIRLGYGRSGVLNKKEIQQLGNDQFAYGDIRVKLHDYNYAGTDIRAGGVFRDEPLYATDITLVDEKSMAEGNQELKTYDANTPYYFIMELKPAWAQGEATVTREQKDGLSILNVSVNGKKYTSFYNAGNQAVNVSANELATSEEMNTLFYEKGKQPQTAPVDGGVSVEPHKQVVLVSGGTAEDHENEWGTFPEMLKAFEETPSLFGIIPATANLSSEETVFTDIKNHWAKEEILKGVSKDLVSGYPDNTFRPDNSVTVGEVIAFILRAEGHSFTAEGSDWKKPYIQKALETGLILPEEFENFDRAASREEVVLLLYRTGKVPASTIADISQIKDFDTIGEKFKDAVISLYNEEIIVGFEDGTFRPHEPITRGQMITALLRIIDKYVKDE